MDDAERDELLIELKTNMIWVMEGMKDMKNQSCNDCALVPRVADLEAKFANHEEIHKQESKSKTGWAQWIMMALLAIGTIIIAFIKKVA